MNGGQLSYQGIDLLRQLETNGEKYEQNTIIHHSSSLKCVCAVVDKYASIVVPFKMDKLEDGTNKMFRVVFERLDSLEGTLEPSLPEKRKKIGLKDDRCK